MNPEELLERYFNADTTVGEERQLREYLAGADVPQHLQPYRAMFGVLAGAKAESHEQAKAESLLQAGTGSHTQADAESHEQADAPSRLLRFYRVLRPMLRATGCVAVMLVVAMVAEQGMEQNGETHFVTPTNSQSVGIEVSEWGGMDIVECPADTIAEGSRE